jgi:hypothetical protein
MPVSERAQQGARGADMTGEDWMRRAGIMAGRIYRESSGKFYEVQGLKTYLTRTAQTHWLIAYARCGANNDFWLIYREGFIEGYYA